MARIQLRDLDVNESLDTEALALVRGGLIGLLQPPTGQQGSLLPFIPAVQNQGLHFNVKPTLCDGSV